MVKPWLGPWSVFRPSTYPFSSRKTWKIWFNLPTRISCAREYLGITYIRDADKREETHTQLCPLTVGLSDENFALGEDSGVLKGPFDHTTRNTHTRKQATKRQTDSGFSLFLSVVTSCLQSLRCT